MTVEQTIDIPADRRITIDVPQHIPVGKAVLAFTPISEPQTPGKVLPIEEVRKLLRKEMTEKGTLDVKAESGDGWTAHVMEHYAKS